jgi:DNA-binding transcriptional LysR family regulator
MRWFDGLAMSSRKSPLRFDLTSLQLFVAVAEELSLTKAANREHLVLSAASKRITELEDAVGSPLLYRHARGVTLTPAGQSLLHYSRQVLQTLHRMQGELSEFAEGIQGHIRMHAIASAIIQFLPEELDAFLTQYPRVKIDLEERVGPEIVRAVAEGTADIGIIAEGTPATGLELLPYHTDRLVVVTPKRHPLTRLKSVRLAETLEYDYVGPRTGSSLYSLMMRGAMEAGGSIKLRVQVRSFDGMCRMIQANLGIGILPAGAIAPQLKSMGIRTVALTEDWASRKLYVCVRELDSLPVTARQLVRHLSRPTGS